MGHATPYLKTVFLAGSPSYGRRRPKTSAFAKHGDTEDYKDYFYRRSIEEDMVVLRKRIHDIRMLKRKEAISATWMAWEKRYYLNNYSADVCNFLGSVQSVVMNTRAVVVLGACVLVLACFASVGVVCTFKMAEFVNLFLSSLDFGWLMNLTS